MSVNPISGVSVPVQASEEEENIPVVEEVKGLTTEELQDRMKKQTTRYIFEQMLSSNRRYTQEMMKEIQRQKEEDES